MPIKSFVFIFCKHWRMSKTTLAVFVVKFNVRSGRITSIGLGPDEGLFWSWGSDGDKDLQLK